jgi:hypothetical protein
MRLRPVAMAICGLAALALAVPPALAASPGPYAGYEQSAYLTYLDAPARGGDLTRPPRLRISFGGRSYAVVMDTGSTGIVVWRTRSRTSSVCSRLARTNSLIPAPAAS